MINTESKIALIIGHPGHELRIFHFIEKFKPRFYVLTDGSGSINSSRIDRTSQIIDNTGCSIGNVFGTFTDKEIYKTIKNGDLDQLFDVMKLIVEDLIANDIDVVVGDGLEGYNPTHDVCRYMVNGIVQNYERLSGKKIPNYAFALDGPPNSCPRHLAELSYWSSLSDQAFYNKYEAAKNYPEIAKDMQALISQYGQEPFRTECLWPVLTTEDYVSWDTDMPFYEKYGKKKVEDGVYKEAITYSEHLLPLARACSSFSI